MRQPLEGETGRSRHGVALGTLALVSIAVALGAPGCGSEDSAPKATAAAEADPMHLTVAMTYSGYNPDTLTIPQGATVTWINTGFPRATAENFSSERFHFDIHTLYPGQAKSVRFTQPGRYSYHSSYDPGLFSGDIVVKPREQR
jgi:plastocyanin